MVVPVEQRKNYMSALEAATGLVEKCYGRKIATLQSSEVMQHRREHQDPVADLATWQYVGWLGFDAFLAIGAPIAVDNIFCNYRL